MSIEEGLNRRKLDSSVQALQVFAKWYEEHEQEMER